jgi:hypothetical protein
VTSRGVSSLEAPPLTGVRALPLTVDLHPSLLGYNQDVWGGAAFPPPAPAGSRPTASTAPAPSGAVVLASAPLSAPVGPTPIPADQFMLPPIKSGSDYLQTWDLILFWFCCHGFFTGNSDTALITDTANSLLSQYWEGQLWMAVQDDPVQISVGVG